MAPTDPAASWALPTPFGPDLRLRADEAHRLVGAAFREDAAAEHPSPPPAIRDPLKGYMEDPASGLPDLRLDLSTGTAFQRRVWEALRSIPAGETRTYGEVAAAAGAPGGARAAGQAVGANPLPLLVPCHRVVPAAGGVGGYSAGPGPSLKRDLLAREGVDVDG